MRQVLIMNIFRMLSESPKRIEKTIAGRKITQNSSICREKM